ncbi:MAG: GNAT family N-acetyltransferase [Acidobacteriota bacterium]|nr:GNAT family N-acetyltransferase [Acidobacteriota bacterium]
MAIQFRRVDGREFAIEAAAILSSAWQLPGLHYSPEYLQWQLSFPGEWPVPAIAAFSGSTPVGFAAGTHRRMRYQTTSLDAVVVSFVAVHPGHRNQGIAAGLYRNLLALLMEVRANVLTFAQSNSAGQRMIQKAYPDAGFQLTPFGTYGIFGCMGQVSPVSTPWSQAAASESARDLSRVVDLLASGNGLLWSDPSEDQLRHYEVDPRDRRLLMYRDADGTLSGAAWAVRAEHATSRGIELVPTIECLWLDRSRTAVLRELAAVTANVWSNLSRPSIVHASNLCGFDAEALRREGFRQIAASFQGYAAAPSGTAIRMEAMGCNLEVV